MGDTAQSYFVPSLMKISDFLKLSPNVAGVTLLALGNGINDIASIAIGVIFTGSTGFAVGGPIGSSLFITTIILGVVLIVSHVEVGRLPFFRDLTFFLITTGFVFYMYMMQRVRVWESVICLIFYVFYVVVVLLGPVFRKCFHRIRDAIVKKPKKGAGPSINDPLVPDEEDDPMTEEDDWTGGWNKFPKFASHLHGKEAIKINDHSEISERTLSRGIQSVFNQPLENGLHIEPEAENSIVHSDYFNIKGDLQEEETGEERIEHRPNLCKSLFGRFIDSIGWREKAWYNKVTFVIYEWPFCFTRNLTCFRADNDDWNRWFATLVPIFAPIWIFTAINPEYVVYMIGGVFPIILIFIFFGIPISILIFVTTRTDRPPIYQPVLVILCFLLSSFWIYFGAKELLDVLSTLGIIWGISDSILAVTILAWGNSLGDAVSDIVVARQGAPKMAIGAIFGGPLLNILIGLGIAFTFNAQSLQTGCFPLEADGNVSLGFIFLIFTIITSLIVVPIHNKWISKMYGVFLILVYVIYVVMSIVIAAYEPFGNVFVWNIGPGC
jgi:sodium/potassium/calcium exchanger 6